MSDYTLQAFGDSVTAGDGTRGWVPHLLERRTAEGIVYPLGVAGETSADLRERFTVESRRRAHDWGPVAVVLQTGVNDTQTTVESGARRVGIDAFADNLRALRAAAHEVADVVRVLDTLPVDDRVDPMPWKQTHAYRPGVVERYDERLRDVVPDRERVDVRSRFEGETHKLLDDGVHPNERGNEVIADAVLTALREAFEGR